MDGGADRNYNLKPVQNDMLNLPSQFRGLTYELAKQRTKTERIIQTDFRRPYRPGEDNIYQSNRSFSAEDRGFNLWNLDAWMHFSVGVGFSATYRISKDAVKNGFELIDDPDREDAKAIKRKDITNWARRSNFLRMLKDWQAFNLGMGTGFAVGYWTARDLDIIDKPPPRTPPRFFEIMNPLYFSPQGETLTQSKRINYDTELWEFGGGVLNTVTRAHRDRVFVLKTQDMFHDWRGLSTFDPIKYSILGYFNNLIYIQRGIQNWGDSVKILKYGASFPDEVQARKILEVLELYEMNGKMFLPLGAEFQSVDVAVGKGIAEAMELYKEDISGHWRIPKNQLFGRSEGGGLTSGPAKISKDDYYERVGSDQDDLSFPVMDQFLWRFFRDTDNLYPRWHLNVYKTDEQRIIEESLRLDNLRKKEEIKRIQFENRMAFGDLKDIRKFMEANNKVPENQSENRKNNPKNNKNNKEKPNNPKNPVKNPGNGKSKKMEDFRYGGY